MSFNYNHKSPIPPGTRVRVLGEIDYDGALLLQENERDRVTRGESPGTVFILEHSPPVITLGRRADLSHLLENRETLAERGYQLRKVDRGGDITVHEPGQVVVYFILPVRSKDAGPFVEGILSIAGCFLRTGYGVDAHFSRERPGLWAGNAKLCAAGFDLRGGVSTHGIAINVSNTLEGFSFIVPCGIEGANVTSLSILLGCQVTSMEVMTGLAGYIAERAC